MSKLTMNNTKSEILSALQTAEEKLNQVTSGQMNPQQVVAAKKMTETLNNAEQIMSKDAAQVANELQTLVTNALSNLTKDLDVKKTEILTLDETIRIKKSEIKELFDIEVKANTLAVLINAEQSLRQDFAENRTERVSNLQEELSDLIDSIEKNKLVAAQEIEQMKLAAKKKQEMEEAEWQYDFDRKKKLADDEFEDDKKAREKVLADKETVITTKLADIAASEKEVETLKAKVDSIPGLIQTAKDEAFKEGKAKAGMEYGFEKRALEANSRSEIQILDNKIEYLEKANNQKDEEIFQLKADLKDAYAKIQETANKTVEAAGNSKMISSLENLVREKSGNNK